MEDINNRFILIAPDGGSLKKIYKVAEQIGYKGDIITCSKERDEQGKLSKVDVPICERHLGYDYIIVDDICDGGATFLNIAKEIKNIYENNDEIDEPLPKIYLIVTHSIFSKGTDELLKYFDGIYCTNSYKEIDLSISNVYGVKQLNVF